MAAFAVFGAVKAAAGAVKAVAPTNAAKSAILYMQPTPNLRCTLPYHGSGVNSLTVEGSARQSYAGAMTDPREREEMQRREALASLKQLGERDTFATSALARTAQRATDHFAAKDAMADARAADGSVDRIELWGRRIGRGLSLLGLIVLAIFLYFTYVR